MRKGPLQRPVRVGAGSLHQQDKKEEQGRQGGVETWQRESGSGLGVGWDSGRGCCQILSPFLSLNASEPDTGFLGFMPTNLLHFLYNSNLNFCSPLSKKLTMIFHDLNDFSAALQEREE